MLRTSLGQRHDELWAAFEVALNVGRQSGKGSVLEARELVGLFLLHEPLIIHSAHEFKTSFEHFLRMCALVEGTPMLDSRVRRIRRGAGEQAIELVTGARLRFVARSGGASGRGFSAPCVVIDEAQEMTSAMLGAMMPTLAAQKNPQVWYAGSAEHSKSYAWHAVRNRAIEAKSPRLFYAGWNNSPDVVDNQDAVRRANPAFGIRISAEFVDAERAAMPPAEFRRERLGIPDQAFGTNVAAGPIDVDAFTALTSVNVEYDRSTVSLACVVAYDRSWTSIGAVGVRPDGLTQCKVVAMQPGTAWAAGRLKELSDELGGVSVAMAKNEPLIDDVEASGVTVVAMSGADQARASQKFIDACSGAAPTLRHRGEPALIKALSIAVPKPYGDGNTDFSGRTSPGDISPLKSLTLAFGQLGSDDGATNEPMFAVT